MSYLMGETPMKPPTTNRRHIFIDLHMHLFKIPPFLPNRRRTSIILLLMKKQNQPFTRTRGMVKHSQNFMADVLPGENRYFYELPKEELDKLFCQFFILANKSQRLVNHKLATDSMNRIPCHHFATTGCSASLRKMGLISILKRIQSSRGQEKC